MLSIESDDVVEFLGETRVIAELEGLDAVGLEASQIRPTVEAADATGGQTVSRGWSCG